MCYRLKVTQTEFARRLGVSRLSVSELLRERRALSPEMAARIGKVLRTSPDIWVVIEIKLNEEENKALQFSAESVRKLVEDMKRLAK